MTYTLQQCINKTNRIKRKHHVINILTDNDITDWDSLILSKIPTKGLWLSEVMYLDDLRRHEIYIRALKNDAKEDLKTLLSKYFSKHETTRVFNILTAHEIVNSLLLFSKSDDALRNIPGIGPKTIDILTMIRQKARILANIEAASEQPRLI